MSTQAAPGDTTWVQAHYGKWLDWYNNFDTTIKFPDGSTKYRKVIMIFTLGKYVCPGSPTYCSDWDYTVQFYARNKAGDTVELARMITPYGKGPRMPASWQQPYYFDVTDFAHVLKDTNTIRLHYSGYSGGFTADVRFAMIEGTPDRDVLDVKSMWDGSFAYGDAANPIDAKVSAVSLTAPAGTASAVYRLNITGHGSDPNYCSEFCAKYYRVNKDASMLYEKLIWRDNCGFNHLYPQSGTWIYDRANWCPGDRVHTNFHPLPGVSGGTTFSLGMTFEPYTSSGAASYIVSGAVVYYGTMNKSLDASLEDILAPTNNPNYFRENARVGYTTIKVHNSGSSTINNIEFEYGVTGSPLTKATWTGTLASLADTIIDLPFANSLLNATGSNLPYEVNITKVNGAADEDRTNDKFTSVFTPPVEWPKTFVITMNTNKATTGSGVSETEWRIIDLRDGHIVKERVNNSPSTNYTDTVTISSGVYKFSVSDAGCDGLSWWANSAAGTGSLAVKPTLFTSITLTGLFGGDFGCGFDQYFKVGDPVSIPSARLEAGNPMLEIYPNPASDRLNLRILNTTEVNGVITLTDNTGKTVYSAAMDKNEHVIPLAQLANGVYFISYIPADGGASRLYKKCVILK